MSSLLGTAASGLDARRFAFGGTALLGDFLESCAVTGGGSLFFTAPFYDEPFLVQLVRELPASTTVHILVKRDDAADKLLHLLSRYRRGAVNISVADSLHAKVYILESPRRDVTALIGSHNPTIAGLAVNLEAGVLIAAAPHTRAWTMVIELREFLKSKAIPYVRTLGPAAHTRSE
jgi:hypothetical protein